MPWEWAESALLGHETILDGWDLVLPEFWKDTMGLSLQLQLLLPATSLQDSQTPKQWKWD